MRSIILAYQDGVFVWRISWELPSNKGLLCQSREERITVFLNKWLQLDLFLSPHWNSFSIEFPIFVVIECILIIIQNPLMNHECFSWFMDAVIDALCETDAKTFCPTTLWRLNREQFQFRNLRRHPRCSSILYAFLTKKILISIHGYCIHLKHEAHWFH